MDQTQPTRLGSLILQGVSVVAASVIAAASVGSFITTGDVYYSTAAGNVSPTLLYDSGSYLTYMELPLTRSGSTSYMTADFQIPAKFASGAVIQRVMIDNGVSPLTLSGVLALHPTSKMSMNGGTVFRRFIQTSTGTFIIANTGTLITTKIPTSQYITYTGTGGGGVPNGTFTNGNTNVKVKLWLNAKNAR